MRPLALLALALQACASGVAVGQSGPTVLQHYDFENRARRFDLPGRLDEISGLAFTPDGRLFGHDDERGRVHEIDPRTGEVGKSFDVGEEMVRGDFEGMAIAGERFFLVSSRGQLYELREAAHDAWSPYLMTDTGVGATCEVEGLDHDVASDALLLVCKVSSPDRGRIVIHRIPLDPSKGRLPPLEVEKVGLTAFGLTEDFDASAIAVGPTGTYLILSGRHDALIEVDQGGTILSVVRLSKGRHPQSEGLAFGPDGTLYIADEKNGKEARLTAYSRLESENDG